MKKLFSSIVCIITCCVCMAIMIPAAVFAAGGDEIRAAKRVISVVYDDSGSMKDDGGGFCWSFANYSMQALISLLNEQDELYITFMSSPNNAVRIDISDIPGSIKKIHDWDSVGGTPGEAVTTARNQLDAVYETDPTVQYWLVIMTDGIIDFKEYGLEDKVLLQKHLDIYKNNTMSNGSQLNAVYMGMGETAVAANGDPSNGLHAFCASDASGIVNTLRDVANLISGRIVADKLSQVNDKTIEVETKLPLYSISILSQKSSAKVAEVKSSESKLTVQRNIPLNATDLPYGANPDFLFGNAAVANLQSGGAAAVIPAGKYTISFSESIDLGDITVQFEPAIGIKAEIRRSGILVDDINDLVIGDKVDIKIIPVVPGTDQEIPASDLPAGMSWMIEYEVDGNVTANGSGTELSGVTIEQGGNIIRGTITIPGFTPSVSEISFNITEREYHFNIKVDAPEQIPSFFRAELSNVKLDESNTINFWICDDETVLTKEEQKKIGTALEVAEVEVQKITEGSFFDKMGSVKVKCKLKLNDDGSWTLIPDDPLVSMPIMIVAGDYTITVRLTNDNDITAQCQIKIVPQASDAFGLIKIALIILGLIYLIDIFLIKKKFKGQVVHYENWRLQEDGTGYLQKGTTSSKKLGYFTGKFFLPGTENSTTFHGLKLVAESGGSVKIPGNSIANAVYAYGAHSSNPETSLGSISSQLHKTQKKSGKKEASDQTLSKRYIYFKNAENSKDIWRIWLTES